MQQLIYFIQKYKYFLFFLLLQCVALALTINNHNFHKSKFISSANTFTGSIYNQKANFSNYLHLKKQNTYLSKENKELQNLLVKYTTLIDTLINTKKIDTIRYHQKYNYINGKIIQNEFHKPYNYLTINRGKKDSVTTEMAVINSKGIIGITDAISNNYARVQSILNRNSKINARFKSNHYFGTLTWNGDDYNIVQLTDIPRQTNIAIGDTIITGGKSAIFPEGILIGKVINLPKNPTASNTIDVQLFNDMSNLSYIYIVKNLDKIEIKELENQINE